MKVSLTFDNGPSPGTTEGVLDVLADHDVRATFFVVGSMLLRDGARQVAERARDEGHWIGNHSMSHAEPLGTDEPEHAVREITEAQALLGDLAHPRHFFRPFGLGGKIGPHLLCHAAVEALRDGGYTCVLWTCVPRDWEDPVGWVDTALAHVARSDHAVVVLHDLPTTAMDALPRFLGELRDRGVEITQDLPASVIPIDRGAVGDLHGLVSA